MECFWSRLVLTSLLALGALGSARGQMSPLSSRPASLYAPQAGAFRTPAFAPRGQFAITPLIARPSLLYGPQASFQMALSPRPSAFGRAAPLESGSLVLATPFASTYANGGMGVAPYAGTGMPGAAPGAGYPGSSAPGTGPGYVGGEVGVPPNSGQNAAGMIPGMALPALAAPGSPLPGMAAPSGYTSGGIGLSPTGGQGTAGTPMGSPTPAYPASPGTGTTPPNNGSGG